VDEDKVAAGVAAVLDSRPGWRRTEPPSFDGGARRSTPAGVSMQDVLQGHRNRFCVKSALLV
jgi:hypothetical protein